MANRKPFDLKNYMIFHNICQIIACVYAISEMLTDKEMPPLEYFSKCVKRHSFVNERNLYKLTMFLYFLKASEMTETVVFALRKKTNQISFLHVFHHSVMVLLVYFAGNTELSKILKFFKYSKL